MVKELPSQCTTSESIKEKTNGVDCLKKLKLHMDKDTTNKVKSGSYLQNTNDR